MTREEFLNEMREVLQRDDTLDWNMPLETIAEWDSLALMGTAAFLSHAFSVRVGMDEFRSMKTVADIGRAAGLACL